jgi:hypothetical protein
MRFLSLIDLFKTLYREKTRTALTDVRISANKIFP